MALCWPPGCQRSLWMPPFFEKHPENLFKKWWYYWYIFYFKILEVHPLCAVASISKSSCLILWPSSSEDTEQDDHKSSLLWRTVQGHNMVTSQGWQKPGADSQKYWQQSSRGNISEKKNKSFFDFLDTQLFQQGSLSVHIAVFLIQVLVTEPT